MDGEWWVNGAAQTTNCKANFKIVNTGTIYTADMLGNATMRGLVMSFIAFCYESILAFTQINVIMCDITLTQ